MKYYEILPTHTETPRNTTRKIANLYIEFNYHFLTLQKKIPLLLNRSVHITSHELYGIWTHLKLIFFQQKEKETTQYMKNKSAIQCAVDMIFWFS